jgi:hypothetical protein
VETAIAPSDDKDLRWPANEVRPEAPFGRKRNLDRCSF